MQRYKEQLWNLCVLLDGLKLLKNVFKCFTLQYRRFENYFYFVTPDTFGFSLNINEARKVMHQRDKCKKLNNI
jgi:hypothetical protein